MDFNQDTERRQATIQGLTFAVPQPFEEGHECSVNEASALNQLLVENLRNNFASNVAKAKEEAEKAGTEVNLHALQDELNGYIQGYEFGIRGGGGARLDPVESIARKLALKVVRERIKAAGYKLSEFSTEKLNELAAEAIEQNPVFMEKAKTIHEIESAAGETASVQVSA